MRRLSRYLALPAAAAYSVGLHAQTPLETVDVVGQTPLGGLVDADRIAANVQQIRSEELEAQRALDLADFMKRNLASVFVNEAQSNPLQPDVQYRGFVGSPLLGLPQGLAVYQNGVRINEPFGDTVNWALIPESAIAAAHLMPGSNPLFGLNALGGAIAIDTKDGFSNPGSSAEIYGGSFSRFGLQAETGASKDGELGYFLTGSHLEEDGWRDFSPTEATQLFATIGRHSARTSLDLGLTLADTELIGNGPAPAELLAADREAIYTRPDITENRAALLNFSVEHELSPSLLLTGDVYVRYSDIDTLNGDDSDVEECAATPGFLCEEEEGGEELVLDAGGSPIPAAEALEGAAVNRTSTEQDGMGLGFQASWATAPGGRANRFLVGIAYDESDIAFASGTELGALDDTRLAVPGGVSLGSAFTRLAAANSTSGIYLSNTFDLTEAAALTVSGRYNRTDIELRDRIGTALDGDHRFERFNPAVGITFAFAEAATFYASYSEASRVPSPVELTCADEDDPCRLPNAFLADPPLEQVVAATIEAGLRGEWAGGSWNAGLFRTANEDDILFISAGALTNEGYFDNIGETRRQGIEVGLARRRGERWSWFANYTLLDATFEESLALPSANNPAAVAGEVFVSPGDRLPLMPRQLLKAGFTATVVDKLTLGANLTAGSDFHMRGDEGNDVDPIGDYAVLNLRADYALSDTISIFLNVDNVLDEDYETFGLFGEPAEVLGSGFDDARFFSPAPPRAAWAGVRLTF